MKHNSILEKILVFGITLVLSASIYAKPMPQRLGVGIKDNTTESIPSVAVVYNVNNDFSFTGGFGFDTKKDYSSLQVNAGLRHVIFHENNLHFYSGGQFAILNAENPVDGKQNGFDVRFVLGAEFFLTALDNVGFSFEGGFALSSLKETRVRTVADGPLKAGIIFYF